MTAIGRSRRSSHAAALAILFVLATLSASGCLREQGPVNGPALVPGMQLCVGVPPQICQDHVASLRQAGHGALVAYRITCTHRPACTLQEGEATIDALYADGSAQSGGAGWAAAEPAP